MLSDPYRLRNGSHGILPIFNNTPAGFLLEYPHMSFWVLSQPTSTITPLAMLEGLHRQPSYTIPELIAIGINAVLIARYSAIAVYTVQVYDWLLTLHDEYRLIHKSRWSSVKIAYLFCRYYPLLIYPMYLWFWVGNHTKQSCKPFIHPLYAMIVPFQISAQAVILIRVYAFTGRSRFVLAGLGISLLALLGMQIWLFATQYILVEEIYILLPKTGCFANDKSSEANAFVQKASTHAGLVMLATFLVDVFMTSAMIIHCLRIRSTQGPLGKEFLTQGIGAFVVMSGLNLLSSVVYLTPNRQYNGIGLPFVMILSDIMACRLILHLRARVSRRIETFELQRQSRITLAVSMETQTGIETEQKTTTGLSDWT